MSSEINNNTFNNQHEINIPVGILKHFLKIINLPLALDKELYDKFVELVEIERKTWNI